MDDLTPEQRHKCMSHIKSKNTSIEILLRKALWHGKNWETRKKDIKTNRGYWIPKIERNITRDNENDKKLENNGWIVLHFWGKDIQKNLNACVNEIKEIIYEIKHGIYNPEFNSFDFLAAENDPEYNIKGENKNYEI
jgi:DNA mismatch endonuclease (patch repair protein)